MKIIYECEKLAVLEDDERFIVHILDNYRMVKEITTNSKNLPFVLNDEFNLFKTKKVKNYIKKIGNMGTVKQILNTIWSLEESKNGKQ